MKKKIICPPSQCTGCWACFNKCPKKCISMIKRKLGHLYPTIEQEKCINCGLCEKVCPINRPQKKVYPQKAYASWQKDPAEYASSTSGGIAAALSNYIIEHNGIVYGCACLDNINICHVRIEDKKDLYKLKGSKYVQSSINNIYRLVKQDLKANHKVLFIGTPCQVAGLKSYIGGSHPNLYLVDLICHGVPSLHYLQQHVTHIAAGKEWSHVRFRDGNDMVFTLSTTNNQIIYYSNLWKDRFKDIYYNAFIDGFTYRDSCHTCPYANPNRVSDMTIGDFWGLKDDIPQSHNHGVSCILPITAKGTKLLTAISDKLYLYERPIEEVVNGNDQLRSPKKTDIRIKIFLVIYKLLGIDIAYRLCVLDRILRHFLIKHS